MDKSESHDCLATSDSDMFWVLWLTLLSRSWSPTVWFIALAGVVCAKKMTCREGKRCYNYCTTMGLWPAEAMRQQWRVTKLVSVGFSTGLLALVPHCIVFCFLWYPVKLVRPNNTTITSTDCRLMLMLVMILMIPLTINHTLAELCHVSWGM